MKASLPLICSVLKYFWSTQSEHISVYDNLSKTVVWVTKLQSKDTVAS